MNWDKIFDAVINKLHVALGTLTQGIILAYHFKTGHDIGPNVQSTVMWFYGFLAGHAAAYQVWPDKKDGDNAGHQ